jgi:hypothetical protein
MRSTTRAVLLAAVALTSSALSVTGCAGVGEDEPAEKTEPQKAPRRDNVFEGAHENLEMGDTALWQRGFRLRLSDARLGTSTASAREGNPALVVQMEAWHEGQSPILLAHRVCDAVAQNGTVLETTSTAETQEVPPTPPDSTLEPGQERSAPLAFELPSTSGSGVVTLRCSLAYATTGQGLGGSGKQPPPGALATWTVDTSNLSRR